MYRSVLLKRRPREQQTDENMEVDPPAEQCKDNVLNVSLSFFSNAQYITEENGVS